MEAVGSANGIVPKIRAIFGSSAAQPAAHAKEHAPSGRHSEAPGRQARRELLQQITDFLLDNDLAVSPANLSAACEMLSGSNARLARKVSARQAAGGKIDQDWLDSVTEEAPGQVDKQQAVEKLITKLDGTLSTFSATARSARQATADYSTELQQHVEQTSDALATGQVLSTLAELAKAMLERNQLVEEEMKRSEREADGLRKSLEKAQRDAEIDHLTGLPNRRAFEGLLETQYREAQKAIEPLSVAFCDIDHFKRINDTHGHDAGDRVIQKIAQVLSEISNENCHVARHGGEEFVMLFRGLTRREAYEKLDRAREALSKRKIVNRVTDQPFGSITFSGGVADVFAYSSPRDALRAADEALYLAKESGRNRIEIA